MEACGTAALVGFAKAATGRCTESSVQLFLKKVFGPECAWIKEPRWMRTLWSVMRCGGVGRG